MESKGEYSVVQFVWMFSLWVILDCLFEHIELGEQRRKGLNGIV